MRLKIVIWPLREDLDYVDDLQELPIGLKMAQAVKIAKVVNYFPQLDIGDVRH
jgi:hypothetical protein